MVASYEKSNQMPLKKPEKLYQLACYSQVLQKKKKRYLDQVSHSKLTAPEVMLVFEKNIVLSNKGQNMLCHILQESTHAT